jgi:chorismate synthase
MTANTFGEYFRVTTFGESHGAAIGCVVDGVRPGLSICAEDIQQELDKRRPGTNPHVSQRKENDRVEILSGIFEGKTTGAPIALLIRNHDARSHDYNVLKNIFRPGHADFTWWKKYGLRDWRGGGRASGRETAGRVAAGAIAQKVLGEHGIYIFAHVVSIGNIVAKTFEKDLALTHPLRCGDPLAATLMQKKLEEVREQKDSVGGVIEIVATGVPVGLGEPVFDKLESIIGAALLSIGGVKGVEFGDGFGLTTLHGSQSNDPITPEGFSSNHMGGILGGISNGEPIVVRIAVKPTASIGKPQRTVDIDNNPVDITVEGRHDPCLCPRIVPVAQAMVALALCEAWHAQNE